MLSERKSAKLALKELISTFHQTLPMLLNAAVSIFVGYEIGKNFLEEPIVGEAAEKFGFDENSEILVPIRYFAQSLGMLPIAYLISLLHNFIPNSIKLKVTSNQSALNLFSDEQNSDSLENLIDQSNVITENPQLGHNLTKAMFAFTLMLIKTGSFTALSTFTAAGMTLAAEDFLQNFLEMDIDEANETIEKITYAVNPIFLLLLIMGTHEFIQSSVNEFKPHALATLNCCGSLFDKRDYNFIGEGEEKEEENQIQFEKDNNITKEKRLPCTIL